MLIERAQNDLNLSREYLTGLAARASHCYRRIELPKASGGRRVLHQPAPELKCLQRWLNGAVLSELPINPAAYAYRKGVRLDMHARQHATGRFLMRLDLVNFFPSIVRRDVERYMAANARQFGGWSSEDCGFFLSILLRFGRLTIGAPSSPSISNALCAELDERVAAYCSPLDVSYTRYADDLYFSCAVPNILRSIESVITQLVRKLPYPEDLWVNGRKTRHASRRTRRTVTGVVLTPGGDLSVGRSKKRMLRSAVFRVAELSEEQRIVLGGVLGATHAIEPTFLLRLRARYGTRVDQLLRAK